MSWYRRIDIRIHGDKRVRALSKPQPNGQTLWTYVLTGPHTANGLPGLFHVSREDLAARLGWPMDDFMRVWAELEADPPLALGDWDCHVVWAPNSIKYNLPKNDNIVIGWSRNYDLIPECDLVSMWTNRVLIVLQELAPKRVKQFREQFREQLGKQFPEQFANTHTHTHTQTQTEEEQSLPLAPTAPASAIMMPVKGGEFPITESDIEKWCLLYKNINVTETLKRMVGHWESVPKNRRKTKRGIKTSINRWLASDNSDPKAQSATTKSAEEVQESLRRKLQEEENYG